MNQKMTAHEVIKTAFNILITESNVKAVRVHGLEQMVTFHWNGNVYFGTENEGDLLGNRYNKDGSKFGAKEADVIGSMTVEKFEKVLI